MVDAMSRDKETHGYSARMTCEHAPVQIEGDVDGHAFYFRARGISWSIGFSRDAMTDAQSNDKRYVEHLEKEHPRRQAISGPCIMEAAGSREDCSFMPHDEAWSLCDRMVEAFRIQQRTPPLTPPLTRSIVPSET